MNAYEGRDRRRHKKYVTRNTEYHLRDKTCVGVRDLWSGAWRKDHPALGKILFGAVRPGPQGLEPQLEPSVQSLLWFENGDNDILTSRLTGIERPQKVCLPNYI